MEKPAFVFDGRIIVDVEQLKDIGFKVCNCYLSAEVEAYTYLEGRCHWPRRETLTCNNIDGIKEDL